MKLLVIGLALIFILLTVLPVVRNDWWVVRACDFPRLQIVVAGIGIVGGYVAAWDTQAMHENVVLTLLSFAVGYQVYWVWPYLPYATPQVEATHAVREDDQLTVMVANVWIQNRQAGRFLDLVRRHNPDVVLLLEPDAQWMEDLAPLDEDYPHQCQRPQSNAYGLALFSRYPLHTVTVRTLVDDAVPSVHAVVELPSGERVQFFGVHPRPPHPNEDAHTVNRNAELLLVAQEVAVLQDDGDPPVVVAGDFNDVSWSYVTLMLRRISGLLDPRIGRGPFNTFHARYPFFRCPIDHVLHSHHFRVEELVRSEDFGSDHFALIARLQLEADAPVAQDRPYADATIRRHALEQIRRAV